MSSEGVTDVPWFGRLPKESRFFPLPISCRRRCLRWSLSTSVTLVVVCGGGGEASADVISSFVSLKRISFTCSFVQETG